MTLTIQVPDEIELQLRAEAEKHGLPAEEYVRQMIAKTITLEQGNRNAESQPLTPEERLQRFDAYLSVLDRSGPPLPPEAFQRESFYGERG